MEPSQHQVVCFGEVLWDILPSGALPGGAPMNVAYHLKKLGANPALITKIGTDDYGKRLVNILSENGVTTEYFQVDYERHTGLVYANVNNHHEVVYDIVYPSAWDFIELNEEFTGLLEKADYFVYGSLTSRNKESRDTLYQLLDIAKTKVLDINLRPPHFNRSLVEHLLESANILKMNEAELELITGWFSRFESTEDRMKLMQDQFDIDTLIVTMGSEGAIVSDRGRIHRHPGFTVNVADTIGSGDSFLAGFIHQLLIGASAETALTFASGIGAFIATQSGACPSYEISQITELIHSR
ncbi:carbohydrate kinase family protein [Segetibacter koreensis]|uniref:carbohydrate kinase family protein n=1 Tax=Segetibacter koreensis TaxID=398037 RepID=UPI0003667D6A|nr:carbohydrate kinase [Segetibacter koreensis]